MKIRKASSNKLAVLLNGTEFQFETPELPENLQNLTSKQKRFIDTLLKAIDTWYNKKPRNVPSDGTLVLCKHKDQYFVALQKELF